MEPKADSKSTGADPKAQYSALAGTKGEPTETDRPASSVFGKWTSAFNFRKSVGVEAKGAGTLKEVAEEAEAVDSEAVWEAPEVEEPGPAADIKPVEAAPAEHSGSKPAAALGVETAIDLTNLNPEVDQFWARATATSAADTGPSQPVGALEVPEDAKSMTESMSVSSVYSSSEREEYGRHDDVDIDYNPCDCAEEEYEKEEVADDEFDFWEK